MEIEDCPVCGEERMAICRHTWRCGSRLDCDGVWLQSKDCRIAQLEQQLADARLLARAGIAGLVDAMKDDGALYIFDSLHSPGRELRCEYEHGLPILTDEVRAALRKAVGE